MTDTLYRCRALLEAITPLQADCGQLCGAACCRSLSGEETGMLLFPGEESAYIHRSDCTLRPTPLGTLLLCQGTCRRMERPLSCRMFPLLPLLRPDGVKVAMDARSAAVCPLYRAGRRGLSPAFVEAVRACGQLLAEDPQQRGFLVSLTAQQDEWRALQASFGSARKEKRAHV